MNVSTALGKLRLAAILEGISYLLFAITMPVKYMLEIPEPNYVVGMIHGFLFISYVGLTLYVGYLYKWNFKTFVYALIASIVPTGTFFADSHIFKKMENTHLTK